MRGTPGVVMPQVVILSEGLIELKHAGPGISGDGIAMALAASYLNGLLSDMLRQSPVDVQMLTAAGDDRDGNAILTFCRTNGIGTQWFKLMPLLPDDTGMPTRCGTASCEYVTDPNPVKNTATTYHNRDSENCPIDRLFQNAAREVSEIVAAADHRTVFVVSGIAASRPFREETYKTMLELIRQMKAKGATILVDPNTRLRLFKSPTRPSGDTDCARARLTRLFELADIALPSFPDDLCPQGNVVFPWHNVDAVRDGLFALDVPNVIVKLGPKGSVLFRRYGTTLHIPADRSRKSGRRRGRRRLCWWVGARYGLWIAHRTGHEARNLYRRAKSPLPRQRNIVGRFHTFIAANHRVASKQRRPVHRLNK